MPDFKALIARHKEVLEILYSRDKTYIITDNQDILKKLPIKFTGYLKPSLVLRREFLDYTSAKHGKQIHELFGLEKKLLITYSLQKLTHSKKTLFGYALKGRGKDKGILQELKGKVIGRNSLLIPYSHKEKLQSFMDYWGVKFTTELVYVDIQQKKDKK